MRDVDLTGFIYPYTEYTVYNISLFASAWTLQDARYIFNNIVLQSLHLISMIFGSFEN